MLSYCLKCRKNTESKIQMFVERKNRRIMLSSNCVLCINKISRSTKEQGDGGILGSIVNCIASFFS